MHDQAKTRQDRGARTLDGTTSCSTRVGRSAEKATNGRSNQVSPSTNRGTQGRNGERTSPC